MDPELVVQQDELREQRDKLAFHSDYDRLPSDFYPTPLSLRRALVDNVTLPTDGPIWEPCVGSGHLARTMENEGCTVIGTDLRDESEGIYGKGNTDFFAQQFPPSGATSIITNPPFNMMTKFIEHSLELMDDSSNDITSVITLCRQDHHFTKQRIEMFGRAHFALHCPWRPLWIKPVEGETSGNPRWCFVWWGWTKGHSGPPTMHFCNRTVGPKDEFNE